MGRGLDGGVGREGDVAGLVGDPKLAAAGVSKTGADSWSEEHGVRSSHSVLGDDRGRDNPREESILLISAVAVAADAEACGHICRIIMA